jgi:hypothetical protein
VRDTDTYGALGVKLHASPRVLPIMRRLVLLVVVVAGCAPAHADATSEPPSCVDDGKPFDPKVLAARLSVLAGVDMGGRVPGSDGDRAARALIAARFACLGLVPAGDDGGYQQAFVAAKHATANVVGYIAGGDDEVGSEIIVIGAHHDHLGDKTPNDGGKDALLGANDNASGVVALLAIAQAIKQRGVAPRRTIAFVTFGAEEQGMIGSRYFVANAPAVLPTSKVVQFINLDMVGSHDSRGFVAAMGTFAKQPSRKLLGTLADGFPKLRVGFGGRAASSDHEPFCARGIPYVFFWTPDARCYHRACDTVDRIDLPRMADIAQLAGELAWGLAQSELDLAASRAKLGCGHKK